MDRIEEVKDILMKIQIEDSESFAKFSSEHASCFTEANGNWLFPALYRRRGGYFSFQNGGVQLQSIIKFHGHVLFPVLSQCGRRVYPHNT